MQLKRLQQAKHILIYGLGIEGQSTQRFLNRTAPLTAIVTFVDGQNQPTPPWEKFDILILSQGVNWSKVPRRFHTRITTNAQIFFANLTPAQRRKVIGITGTKGKSTTAKFCAEVIAASGKRVALGGNYGTALLDLFDELRTGQLDYLVAELSSQQLEHLTVSPGQTIFLNLYPDHLIQHGSMRAYARAKSQLWRHQQPGDRLLLPTSWHSYVIRNHIQKIGQTIIETLPLPADYFPAGSIFQALYLRENFGTVAGLAKQLGISNPTIRAVAQKFVGLPHRLESLGLHHDIEWIDDAIATNPTATEAAVAYFASRLGTIILGGQDRRQDFTKLLKTLKKQAVLSLVYASETHHRILQTAQKIGYQNIQSVPDLPEAVARAKQQTLPGKICLLSTAAPSYDRFKNYEELGEQFAQLVRHRAD